jgi:hypothetical protein
MKDIEDEFQNVAREIHEGLARLSWQQEAAATRFFAFWSLRVRIEHSPIPDQTTNGVHGEPVAKDQQERLEKRGCAYVRSDQRMPGRFLSRLLIQMGIDSAVARLQGAAWAIVRTDDGEFICPDTFGQLAAIPVTPTASRYLGDQDATIPRCEVARRNRLAQQSAKRYNIERDFGACPL